MSSPQHQFKVVLVGDAGVGKSNIMLRFIKNSFNANSEPTLGLEFLGKTITLKDKNGKNARIKIVVWDTAGQERYRSISGTYYRGAHGVLLVIDVTMSKEIAFDNARNWIEKLKNFITGDVQIILVGNKIDKKDKRLISWEDLTGFAEELNVRFFEVSA